MNSASRTIVKLCTIAVIVFDASYYWYVKQIDKRFRKQFVENFTVRQGRDQPPPTFHEIVDPEIYNFYSSLLSAGGPWPHERVAILDFPMGFAESFHCSHPLSAEDQKLIDTARANSEQLWYWDKKFHFGRDYILLNMNEVSEALSCVASAQKHQAPARCHAYRNVQDIRYLSIPVFNSNHTRALVTQLSRLNNLEELAIYQKTNNTWKPDRRSLAFCEWSFSIP
jgi:hypothetical protein